MKKFSRLIGLLGYAGAAIIGGVIAFKTMPNSKSGTHLLKNTLPVERALGPSATGDKPRVISSKTNVAGEAASSEDEVLCLAACQKVSTQLKDSASLSDESYEMMLGHMQELAAYLEKNKFARQEMHKLAMTTTDDNKRGLVLDAFKLLPTEQREELGAGLLKSDNWRIRTGGINLSTASGKLTSDKANALITTLTDDPHVHVKTTILGVLKNSVSLKGDENTLNRLSILLNSESDPAVKSEALLTKLTLQDDPLDAMPDVLLALSSKSLDLQFSAIIALERIYESDYAKNGELGQIDHDFIKTRLKALSLMEITPENENAFNSLLNEVDAFYARHFE